MQSILGYQQDPFTGEITPVLGPPTTIRGCACWTAAPPTASASRPSRSGFPIHFDWAWRTLLNKGWEDYVYSYQAALDGESSGSNWLRKPKFSIWIGYDF